MDTDPPPAPPSSRKKFSKSASKLKFTPKPPVQRRRTLVLTKSDSSETDSETDRELIRTAIARLRSGGPKVENKSSDNVTPSHGTGSSTTHEPLKKDKNTKNNSNLKDGARSSRKKVTFSSSSVTKDEDNDYMLVDDESGSSSNSENEYKEPWNPRTYYPISLPVRPPGSRDPEVLNAEEFMRQDVYDETKINSALELGLLGPDDEDDNQMILFRFPNQLPLDRTPVSTMGKEKVGSSSSLQEDSSNNRVGLKDLPNGHIGKMLVYKSGAIKWKLGDTIFDVSAGTPCGSDWSAAMINTESKDCCVLGKVNKRAMVAPDLNSILDNIN